MIGQVVADSSLMLAALLAFLSRLHSELDGTFHRTCLLHDNDSSALLNQIVIHHFENQRPLIISNAIDNQYNETDWDNCVDSLAIVILEDLDIYLQLVGKNINLANMRTVLISTSLHNLVNMPQDSSRLLFVEYNHHVHQVENNASVKMFSWLPGDPNSRQKAYELQDDRVWDQKDRRTQIFWGTVERLSQAPVFYLDPLPPIHINTCDQSDPENCFVYGLFVMMANLITHRLSEGHDPVILPKQVGYNEWYSQFFNHRLKSADFTELRNTRDSLYRPNRRVKNITRHHTSLIKLNIDYFIHGSSRIRPFSTEVVVMVVPQLRNEFRSETFVNVMRMLILTIVASLMVIVSMVRITNEHWKRISGHRHRGRGYVQISLDSWARSLGNSQTTLPSLSPVERILRITLAAFAILAGSFISGELMENLVNVIDVKQIETLQEFLHEPYLRLHVPFGLFKRVHAW